MSESGESQPPMDDHEPDKPRDEASHPDRPEPPVNQGRLRGEQPQTGRENQTSDSEQQQQAYLNHLRETHPELTDKLEELQSLFEKPERSLSDDDKERMGVLSQEVIQAQQVQEDLDAGVGRKGFTEEQRQDPEASNPDDIPQEDGAAINEDIKKTKDALDDLNAAPTEKKGEKLADLRRKITEIGDSEKMKKIRRSKGVISRGLYYSWMTFLVLFVITARAVQGVSKVASAGQQRR